MRKWGPCPGSGAQPWAGMVTCRLRPHGPCWAQNVCTEEHEPPVTEPPQNPRGTLLSGPRAWGPRLRGDVPPVPQAGTACREPGTAGPWGGRAVGVPRCTWPQADPHWGWRPRQSKRPSLGGRRPQEIATGHPCYPLPAAPGAGQQGRAFRSPPRLCPPRTAPAPARQTQRALRGGTCHLHPGATRRGRLGRGLGALFCAVSTAFKTKSVGTALPVSGLSNEQGTFGENENLIFQLKP